MTDDLTQGVQDNFYRRDRIDCGLVVKENGNGYSRSKKTAEQTEPC